MKRMQNKIKIAALLGCCLGSLSQAQTAPAAGSMGPLAAFTLQSRCEAVADKIRLGLGLQQAAVLSSPTSDANAVQNLQGRLLAVQDALADCKDKELSNEIAAMDPNGDVATAQNALSNSVAALQKLIVASSATTNSVDQRLDAQIIARNDDLRTRYLQSRENLVSVKKIHNQVLDALNAQIQGSIDCRILAKKNLDSTACERGLQDAYLAVDATMSAAFANVSSKMTQLNRDLGVSNALYAFFIGEANGIRTRMEQIKSQGDSIQAQAESIKTQGGNIQAQGQQYQLRMQQLIAASEQSKSVMMSLNGALNYYKNLAYYYYNTAAWCAAVGTAYYNQRNPGAAYAYWQWGGYYQGLFAQTVNQTIPGIMNQMQQTQNQMAQMKTEIDSITAKMTGLQNQMASLQNQANALQATMAGLQAEATIQQERQVSLGVVIPKASGEVQSARQSIISLYPLATPPLQNATLVSVNSGKVVDVTEGSLANGKVVHQWDDVGGKNQRWNLVPVGERGSYLIVSVNSSKCLDVNGASTLDCASVIQWQCHGNANQVWRIVPNKDGTVQLVSANSNKCLDLKGAAKNNGVEFQQLTCNGAANQAFQIR